MLLLLDHFFIKTFVCWLVFLFGQCRTWDRRWNGPNRQPPKACSRFISNSPTKWLAAAKSIKLIFGYTSKTSSHSLLLRPAQPIRASIRTTIIITNRRKSSANRPAPTPVLFGFTFTKWCECPMVNRPSWIRCAWPASHCLRSCNWWTRCPHRPASNMPIIRFT